MEPSMTLKQISATRSSTEGYWSLGWEIGNPGPGALTLRSARYPHGRLRSDEMDLAGSPVVEPGRCLRLELEARCKEPPGAEFTNAFLILRVDWHERPWLLLARLTVRVGAEGSPATVTERVSAQPVGFATNATCG